MGIRAENLEKIFEPGFTTQCGSPGLGLAVTRKVIEQHGGTIRVESQEGQGTTFTLTLPLAGIKRSGDPMTRLKNRVRKGFMPDHRIPDRKVEG